MEQPAKSRGRNAVFNTVETTQRTTYTNVGRAATSVNICFCNILCQKMAAIAEKRKFDKKNHLKSSPLKLTWPIRTRLCWNGPWVAPFQNHIRWPRLPTEICFSPLTLPGEFLNIFYMNYAFDLTQNIAKTNIYTCCSSSNICICLLCGFCRVEYCIATSGLGWLVHFKRRKDPFFLLLFLLFLIKCYNMKYFAYVSVLGDVIRSSC
jgi:hypothetical protein